MRNKRENSQKETGLPVRRGKTRNAAVFILTVLEVLVLAFVVEFIIQYSGIDKFLESIDLRQMLIVLFACVYGVKIGLFAAFVESFAFAGSSFISGITWKIQIFTPTNWVNIGIYFFIACVVGALTDSHKSKSAVADYEKKNAFDRYDYLHDLYEGVLKDKDYYEQKLMSSRASFDSVVRMMKQMDDIHGSDSWDALCRVGHDILTCPLTFIQMLDYDSLDILASSKDFDRNHLADMKQSLGDYMEYLKESQDFTSCYYIDDVCYLSIPCKGSLILLAMQHEKEDSDWSILAEVYTASCARYLGIHREDM